MGATRLASGKIQLLFSRVCIFPFHYPDAGRVAPIRACDWSERFLQRVSDYIKCNKIGRAFNAYFERPNLTGRDCSNTYLITR